LEALEELENRKMSIEQELNEDSLIKYSLNKNDYKTYSNAHNIQALINELKEVNRAIEIVKERYNTDLFEIRGGIGNRRLIQIQTNSICANTITTSDISIDKVQSKIKKEIVNKVKEIIDTKQVIKEVSAQTNSYFNNTNIKSKEKLIDLDIKELFIQKFLLFCMKYTDGERFDSMANRLVKNVKWEK